MSGHGATLADVLAEVPHLLPKCLPSHPESARGARIRDLRLISKEISVVVVQAVTRCVVQLGEEACPEPQQMVQLMRYSRLKSLYVMIVTTSARTGPSLAQQLATCTSQMAELLQGMGTAIRGVTDLTLNIRHNLIRSSRTKETYTSTKPPQTCPASFSVITRSVFTMLAVAVPSLQALHIKGCCRDAAFQAFGASCPHLTHLQVEAITLPIKELRAVHQHCPSLASFSLASPAVYNEQLGNYVGLALEALQACTSLFRVELVFKERGWVMFKSGSWDKFPLSLRELVCHSRIHDLQKAQKLLAHLDTLHLQNDYFLNPLEILAATSSRMQQFVVHSASKPVLLQCYGENSLGELSMFRERVAAGLDFVVPLFGLSGSSLNTVLPVLPVLPRVQKCKLDYTIVSQNLFLEHIARVFPNLEELALGGDSLWPENEVMGVHVLDPLTACPSLVKLSVHARLGLDATELAELCARMPGLKVLACRKSIVLSLPHLRVLLAAQGNVVDVVEVTSCRSGDGFRF